MSERHQDLAPQASPQAAAGQDEIGSTEAMAFYRELRDVAIKSAHTGSPLSLLVFEPGDSAEKRDQGEDMTWGEALQTSLQEGLKDCEKVIACGANALFMILLGSELSEAERRVDDLHQTIKSDGDRSGRTDSFTIGVAQRQDCEPLSHFVHRTRTALRSA